MVLTGLSITWPCCRSSRPFVFTALQANPNDQARTPRFHGPSSNPTHPPRLASSNSLQSSRPPDQTASPKAPPPTTKPTTSLPEDAPSLLAQDLELRRLLAESHLLATPTLIAGAEPLPFAAGRTRRKATDLRVQALGSKASILTQQKMPMNMRKGIVAAKTTRESKRRREAKENGVILEREAPVNKGRKKQKGMDPAVDRPGVGRLRGAQLRVSERDVKMIEGTRDTFGRRGRR